VNTITNQDAPSTVYIGYCNCPRSFRLFLNMGFWVAFI